MKSDRDHPRIIVQIPARLSSHPSGGAYELVLTRQLGRGGCMIKGHHKIAPGSILDVTFFVGGRCVSAISRVLYELDRDGEPLTGMEFLHMTPDDFAALEEFVGQRMSPA
jgi:hypothetical protein